MKLRLLIFGRPSRSTLRDAVIRARFSIESRDESGLLTVVRLRGKKFAQNVKEIKFRPTEATTVSWLYLVDLRRSELLSTTALGINGVAMSNGDTLTVRVKELSLGYEVYYDSDLPF